MRAVVILVALILVLRADGARAEPAQPWLGITYASNPVSLGVRILEVHEDTPAAIAGLRPGDEIVELEGVPLTLADQLAPMILQHQVGDVVQLTVWRDGGALAVAATLAEKMTEEELLARRLVGKPAPAVGLVAPERPRELVRAAAPGQVTVLAWFNLRCEPCSAVLDELVARAARWPAGKVRLLGATAARPVELKTWRDRTGSAISVGLEPLSADAAIGRYTIDGGRAAVAIAAIDARGVVRYATMIDSAEPAAFDDAALAIDRLARERASADAR